MNILFCSHVFSPSVGGIETVSLILAEEFVKQGHSVKLVTQTPGEGLDNFPFDVIRHPNPIRSLQLTSWCDVLFHSNISLSTAWPLLFLSKPWVVAYHTWLCRADGRAHWQDVLKQFLTHVASCIAVSEAIAQRLPSPSVVINNPYRDDVFYKMPEVRRDRELVFLGRLVSQKGLDVLLAAMKLLKGIGLTPKLTVIGSGPESSHLQQLTERLSLPEQVSFVGEKTGPELAQLLNAHQIMVVPSRLFEAFGVVALEGIACGCVVLGSRVGGLEEAIGPCGLTYPDEDVQALAVQLAGLLSNPKQLSFYRSHGSAHLAQRTATEVAQAYLKVIEGTVHRCRIQLFKQAKAS